MSRTLVIADRNPMAHRSPSYLVDADRNGWTKDRQQAKQWENVPEAIVALKEFKLKQPLMAGNGVGIYG